MPTQTLARPIPAADIANVSAFMDGIEAMRAAMPRGEWEAFCKGGALDAWKALLVQDPYTRRALDKPRGYAGDATVMDYAYRHVSVAEAIAASSAAGREIYGHTSGAGMSESARRRMRLISDEIRAMAAMRGEISIASFAAGHARELDLLGDALARVSRFHVIDSDTASVQEITRAYGSRVDLNVLGKSVFRVRPADLDAADLVYSMGLFDYLGEAAAFKVADAMARNVRPGGRLVVGNLAEDALNLAYCEAVMDWWMIPRSSDDMVLIGRRVARGGGWRCEVRREGCFRYLVADRDEEGAGLA